MFKIKIRWPADQIYLLFYKNIVYKDTEAQIN